jgi:hypothetical protein
VQVRAANSIGHSHPKRSRCRPQCCKNTRPASHTAGAGGPGGSAGRPSLRKRGPLTPETAQHAHESCSAARASALVGVHGLSTMALALRAIAGSCVSAPRRPSACLVSQSRNHLQWYQQQLARPCIPLLRTAQQARRPVVGGHPRSNRLRMIDNDTSARATVLARSSEGLFRPILQHCAELLATAAGPLFCRR